MASKVQQQVRQQYDIYLNTPLTGVIKAAEAVLLEEEGKLRRFGFRYVPVYLEHPYAFSLDPIQLPLQSNEIHLECLGGTPGILDDYLPDDWGRKIIARINFYQHRHNLNIHSTIDMLSVLGSSRIGAIEWVKSGQSPSFTLGCEFGELSLAEEGSQLIDQGKAFSSELDKLSLLYLANSGTGVGGARPKALVYDDNGAYLAKFNRLNHDSYNNARVELACLLMAQSAGMEVSLGRVETGINGREVLLLNRFDIVEHQQSLSRKHVITVNALHKHASTQLDRGGSFRYDDIADLIRRYSVAVEKDLTQLLRMMLFNQAINNIDTHERNFSFIVSEGFYQLAPAYDMIPSTITGAYPVAGYGYEPIPPLPSEVSKKGKIFGLPKTTVSSIAEQVATAVNNWYDYAEQAGVCEDDGDKVAGVIKT